MVLKNQHCLQCEYKTTKKLYLQRHITSVHEGQKFPCKLCGSTFTQKGNLQKHIKSVHEGQHFECHICEYKSSQKVNLQKHIKSVHGKVKSELESENVILEEYFETDVKSENDSDIELDTSTEIKQEYQTDHDKKGMKEYFETDVKKV